MDEKQIEQEMHQLLQSHRDELSYKMPQGLKDRLLADIDYRPLKPSKPWFWIGSMAFVSCLAFFFVFELGQLSSRLSNSDVFVQEVVSGHVRSLMVDHLSDVASTDQHTVKPWFEGKLDFAPLVKDFAKEGFPLIGGRLDYIDNRSVAALIYRRNQHLINLYEWPVLPSRESSPRFLTRRGYQIFTWQANGMSYWMISDLNGSELQQLTKLWQQD
jgi:anti-sigma factor RsiW